jgi:Type IX secretion system membrane protein PorP/SprF
MKKLIAIFCLLFLVLLQGKRLWSQDVHFSQMNISAMSSSWARMGDYDGQGAINVANRSQWKSVSGVPYQTQFVQGELKLVNHRWSIGGSVHHDKAGDGVWRQSQVSAGVSYQCLSDTNKWNLHLATGASWMQWTWNPELLTWGSQWDGFQFNGTAGSGEYFASQSHHVALHAGLDFRVHWNSRITSQLSWGGFNLGSTKIDMGGTSYRWYPRSNFQQTTRVAIRPNNAIIVQSIWMIQQPSQSTMIWLKDQVIMDTREWNWWGFNFGAGLRSHDALVLQVGGFYRQHEVGLAYDINESDLNSATQGRGAWEVYYRWIWKKPKILQKKQVCPEFY